MTGHSKKQFVGFPPSVQDFFVMGERRISLRHNILTHNILSKDDILTYSIILGDILQEEKIKNMQNGTKLKSK